MARPFASMIGLGDFGSYADYMREASRLSDGNDRREAARARKRGYTTRRIGQNSHNVSLRDIVGSKWRRSGGIVAASREASLARSDDANQTIVPFTKPACNEHWRIDFGVFNKSAPERMMGKATLGRSGNLIEIVFFMGHGAALRDGVMKLLMFDMMQWLLDSGDPLAAGAEFLMYGAVEEGAAGRDKWRRRLGFHPFALDAPSPPERDWRPEGWNPAVYLALNPDLRAAGAMPLAHFRLNGVFEERPYRPGKPGRSRLAQIVGSGALDDLGGVPATDF